MNQLTKFQKKQIDNQRYPYLCFDRVLRLSVKLLYPQILLYRLEKDFYVPSCPVQFCSVCGTHIENVP